MDVFALDFDGVLCDSAPEGAASAWRAGKEIWPDWAEPEPPPDCLGRFVRLRPVIETGYEMILLMRLICTEVADAEIRAHFPELAQRVAAETQRPREELIKLFGRARDVWIERDLSDWLSRHRFYPGLPEKLAATIETHTVFVLTTKQERFVNALLESRGIVLPDERLYGLDSGRAKEDILEELLARREFQNARFHFVEDRISTLRRVMERKALEPVRLYLADWGYNTPEDRERAAAIPRICVCSPNQFLASAT